MITAPARIVYMNFFDFFLATFKKRNLTQKGPKKISKIKKKIFFVTAPTRVPLMIFFWFFWKLLKNANLGVFCPKKGVRGVQKFRANFFCVFGHKLNPKNFGPEFKHQHLTRWHSALHQKLYFNKKILKLCYNSS